MKNTTDLHTETGSFSRKGLCGVVWAEKCFHSNSFFFLYKQNITLNWHFYLKCPFIRKEAELEFKNCIECPLASILLDGKFIQL